MPSPDRDRVAGRAVPDPEGAVNAARGDPPPVRAEDNAVDRSLMTGEREKLGVALSLEVVPFPGATVRRTLLEQFLGAAGIVFSQLALSEKHPVRVEECPLALERPLGDAALALDFCIR